MLLIIAYIFILSNLSIIVRSRHLLGGTITWKPLNKYNGSSIISVLFTQSYQWRQADTYCNESFIFNYPPAVSSDSEKLDCVTIPVSSCGGYSSLKTKGYCTDSSIALNLRASQISNVVNITIGSKFCVAFQSQYWMKLQSPSCNFTCDTTTAKWSIGSCVDLTVRSEGFINTPPVATVVSPIKVPINSLKIIQIPVIDADNDITRCRWSKKTSTLDECGDICGIIPGSTLDSDACTLTFNSTGKTVGDYYAVALMVEDFSYTSINTSLSSVPVQFLIEIVASPTCPSISSISSNISKCSAIYVGIQFKFTLTITPGCSNITILDLFSTPPLQMYKNNLTRVGTTNVWTVMHTWTPTIDQLGSQIYCALAVDNNGIQSDQYCLTFTVVSSGAMLLCPGETTTSTTTITSTSTSKESQDTITVTVLVPITTTDNTRLFALILGLGLPILLLCTSFCLYYCCCREQCNLLCSKRCRRFANRTEEHDDQNRLPDYRQQYIRDQQNSSTEMCLLTENHQFFSPSVYSLPTNDVQFTRDPLSTNTCSMQNDSILIRAYSVQTHQKSIYTSYLHDNKIYNM